VGLGGRSSTCCKVGLCEVSGLRATARDSEGEGEVRLRDPRGLRDPRPEKQTKKKKNKPWVCETQRQDPARSGKKEEEE
jgi:hypothetical protein